LKVLYVLKVLKVLKFEGPKVPKDEDCLRDEFLSEWPMFAISSPSKRKADDILVPVKINGISCKMELDTGVLVTVIPEEMWEKELGSVPLVESSVTLKSYSGNAVPLVRETTAHVQYQTQQVNFAHCSHQRVRSYPYGERLVVKT